MAVLATASDYASAARILLQDTVVPYRYADTELMLGLGLAFTEARKLRPDLFLGVTVLPSFPAADSTAVAVDDQYKVPFLFYVCGWAQARDEENTQDARAAAFFAQFTAKLMSLA